LECEHDRAELGYWIGKPFWGRGYATEAARALVQYGFDTLGLHRIYARHLTRNPASGRVLHKIGMTHEGYRRKHEKKWGIYEDDKLYGILRDDPRP
jgi:RimJ/RimL family protein N-acetyltransferase